jgi:uncharacterized protein (TIGR02687 family)
MDKITQAISRLFEKHRIVFWYDAKRELRQEYETLSLPGIQKIELDNNEHGIKYHILREAPKQKFLLYHEGPQPEDLNNWLLDVLLAHGVFSADQISLWMAELGLRPEYWDLVQEHAEFFRAASRREALKTRLTAGDTHITIRTKMLAVCFNSNTQARLESILEALLSELADDRDEKIDQIRRFNLEDFLWEQAQIHFGYISETPGIRDFAIELFKSCYSLSLNQESALTQDALVFLKRWKDSRRHHQSFETLSEQSAEILGIEHDLQGRDLQTLIDIDYFSLVDKKILSDLVERIVDRTISAGECATLIWRRRTTHWFEQYASIYEAVYFGSQFIAELDKADLSMRSLSDGIRKYQNTWFRLDQYYRKFIFHVRESKQTTLLQDLIELIENLYSNNFLLTVNDNWQQIVDQVKIWDAAPIPNQKEFFEQVVNIYIRNNNKVAVLVSDALRFEIGEELVNLIESEDRYSADIAPMLSMLPSYTQLGMASLLPHTQISILQDGTVQVDHQSTAGKENRAKLLSKEVEGGATALRSQDFLAMNREESRALFRDHAVVYFYHNQIDAAGDTLKTEERVFDAVQDAINEIIDVLKKLTSANYTHILITADHGFIYQNRPIDESEYASLDIQGDLIYSRNRRFVIGQGLKPNASAKHFKAEGLGLVGDFEVSIPKSINRLRLQGSGSRYVHGGASLQEVIIPLIAVHKKRTSDVEFVDVDIITSSATIITSGQFSVAFYQTEPASNKLQARKLRAGIYSQDGSLISNPEELNFDFASENAREREVRVRFVLSRKADDVNNQTVYLKLEEPVPGTSHYKEYKSLPYQLRRSFTSDFDF